MQVGTLKFENAEHARLSVASRAPSSRSISLDRNALYFVGRFRGFRQRHGEHALLERGADLVLIHVYRQRYLPFEATVEALAHAPAFMLALALLLAANRQHVVAHQQLDVILVHAGQLGFDLELLVGLTHLDSREVER